MAMSRCNALLLILLLCTECAHCFECGCNNPDPASAQMCQTLLRTVKDALTSSDANMFTLRRMFFPAGAEPPELLNVTYHLRFTNRFPASLPNCTCTGTDPRTERIFIDPQRDLALRYGWTVIGMYTLIHPALLNQLQFPLPFSIMRLVASDGVPFLWNGYQSLPSAEVVLNIDPSNLTCLPDTIQLDETMQTVTSLVSRLND